MSLQSMIRGLSHAEKLEAMDLLWQELSRVPSNYESPEWHAQILADRLANPDPGKAIPLHEAKSEVKERLNARRTQG